MNARLFRIGLVLAAACCVLLPSARAAYPAANGTIAFSRAGNLFLAAADGTVGGSPVATPGLNPSWNGEGTQIAYDNGTSIRIYTVGTATSTLPLTTGTDPSFSPDGTKIAYVNGNQIWSYTVSGGATTLLSNSTTVDADPTWSPDGSKIAFSRKATVAATTAAIWTMNADGTAQTQLTAGTSLDLRPNYAPGGGTIAFQSDRVGPTQIFTMTTTGGSVTRVTNTSTSETQPAYSPDGTRILFARSGAGIWWVPAGGGTTTQLTTGATDLAPDEQPAVKVGTVSLSGGTTVGSTLTATPSGWQGRNLTYTFNWQRCDTAGNCAATFLTTTSTSSSTYTTTSSDVGAKIQVVVTAANGSGTSTAATSNAVGPITAAPGAPVNTSLPVITLPAGYTAPQIGFYLSATLGTWTGRTPMTFKYQWTKCDHITKNCYDIADATSSFFTPTADLANWDISVTIYATNDAGTTYVRAVPTAPVTGQLLYNVASPRLSGEIYVKSTLSVDTGTWTGLAPITYTYQWKRCDAFGTLTSCTAIADATGTTYVLQPADLDKTIRAFVTAKNPLGTVEAFTNHTFPILPERHYKPSNTLLPAITGSTVPGSLLRATVGVWGGDNPFTFGYQWERCDATGTSCRDLPGGTLNRYVVRVADLGFTIRVKLTARNAYGTATAESAPSDPVSRTARRPKGRRIVGTPGADYLAGGGGDDVIYGLAGNDTILGGAGNDIIYGGPGNDVIFGGSGNNTIYGGPGSDTINVANGVKDVVDCGPGNDRVIADPIDVLINCESVSLVTPSTTPGTTTPPAPPPVVPPPPPTTKPLTA